MNCSRRFLSTCLQLFWFSLVVAAAPAAGAAKLGDVFVIPLENHNFTQPRPQAPSSEQLLGNPAAPYLNSLVTPGNANARQTSYASNYHNIPGLHPSAPNYIWAEAGNNFGVKNDHPPFGRGGSNRNTLNLSGQLQNAGILWMSYQEDIDINTSNNTVLPRNLWTVPLNAQSGAFIHGVNAYNGSHQYFFKPKHDGQLYFTDTNGGDNTSTSNPEISHYAPLQQLARDLAHHTVGRYNWITPDLYNDMHSALASFTYHGVRYTGDQAAVAEGDNFLSIIVPEIMASQAYRHNGVIVIWTDETAGHHPDTASHTLPEIVISPLAKGNAYDSKVYYTHSSDLKTWEELFGLPLLNGAGAPGVHDLSGMFVRGAIPPAVPVDPAWGRKASPPAGAPARSRR